MVTISTRAAARLPSITMTRTIIATTRMGLILACLRSTASAMVLSTTILTTLAFRRRICSAQILSSIHSMSPRRHVASNRSTRTRRHESSLVASLAQTTIVCADSTQIKSRPTVMLRAISWAETRRVPPCLKSLNVDQSTTTGTATSALWASPCKRSEISLPSTAS